VYGLLVCQMLGVDRPGGLCTMGEQVCEQVCEQSPLMLGCCIMYTCCGLLAHAQMHGRMSMVDSFQTLLCTILQLLKWSTGSC
jgi:hypothetical protein